MRNETTAAYDRNRGKDTRGKMYRNMITEYTKKIKKVENLDTILALVLLLLNREKAKE